MQPIQKNKKQKSKRGTSCPAIYLPHAVPSARAMAPNDLRAYETLHLDGILDPFLQKNADIIMKGYAEVRKAFGGL